MAAAYILALILARTPLFRWADAPPDHAKRRVSTIDGLRGFLALAVVLYHGMIYRHWFVTGRWEPVDPVANVLGPGAVILFFMITGYLFWRRLVLAPGRIDWIRLYIGRVFRIGPVFLLAAGLAILVSLQAGRHNHPGTVLLAKQIGYYLFLGVFPAWPVRGYDTNLVLAGVTWSLQYEWLFYAALPLLAILAFRRLHLPASALLFVGLLAALWRGVAPAPFGWDPSLICCFAAGMLVASLDVCGIVPRRHGAWSSLLALALIAALLFWLQAVTAPASLLAFAALFYLVATGCDLFGLLRLRSAHRLGHISYGIYLLQGLALAAVLRPLRSVSAASPVLHLLLLCVVFVLIVLMALVVHRYVEQPGIRLGDTVFRWVARRRGTLTADRGAA